MRAYYAVVASTLDHPERGEIEVLVHCTVTPGMAGSYYDPPEPPEVWIDDVELDTDPRPVSIGTKWLDVAYEQPQSSLGKWLRRIEDAAIDQVMDDDDGPEYEHPDNDF